MLSNKKSNTTSFTIDQKKQKRKTKKYPSQLLKVCQIGVNLLTLFLITIFIAFPTFLILSFSLLPDHVFGFILAALLTSIFEFLLFWIGIICIYCTSIQLGLKIRIIGIVCGMMPIINLIVLIYIIRIVSEEIRFEVSRADLNASRSEEHICQTRYPVLLVHGVFFRDFKHANYWGRIPADLIANGANVYYGNHHSAASVSYCGKELSERIKEILSETHAEKVNIIAHSKGGLDCRYAITHCGMAPYVASLTTINTPHCGCEFADYLLNKVPAKTLNQVASSYNLAMKKLGDLTPDFVSAVSDLTSLQCQKFNQETPDAPEVFYQSVGSKLIHATSGKFPLNFTYPLVKYFDGPNDGLVSETSFHWGSDYMFLVPSGKRGISHADMIDLNRENIKGFDVREFYIELLSNLRKKGY